MREVQRKLDAESVCTPQHNSQDNLAESTRTVSAYLGEIEDKLDRALLPPAT